MTESAAPSRVSDATRIRHGYPYDGFVFGANLTGGNYPNGSVHIYGPGSYNEVIGGKNTELDEPLSVAVGPNGKIFVTEASSGLVLGYAPGSSGNVAPSTEIGYSGLATGPNLDVAFGPDGNVWVANYANFLSAGFGYIAAFPPGTNGNKAPVQSFESQHLNEPSGLTFDTAGNIYVANGVAVAKGYGILTFASNASGPNATPIAVLKEPMNSPSGQSDWFPWGVAVDSLYGSQCRTLVAGGWYTGKGKYGGAYWASGYEGRIMVWNQCPPKGTKDPDAFITSSVFVYPRQIALDSEGNIYVADSGAGAIFEFSASAHENATPVKTFSGGEPWGVAIGTQEH